MPTVPPLPDTERRTSYSPVASTGPFDLSFALYGSGTDYDEWVDVWLDGELLTPVTDWTLDLVSGTLATAARPLTNARITLVEAATGDLQIVGDQRPQRTSQFTEGVGVSAHDMNLALTGIIATQREFWDAMTRVLRLPPGDIAATFASAEDRASKFVGFNSGGVLTLFDGDPLPSTWESEVGKASWGRWMAETDAVRDYWYAAGVARPRQHLLDLLDHTLSRFIDCGAWALLNWLYLPSHDPIAHCTNLRNPGTFNLSRAGSLTHVPLRGHYGDGVSGYLSTGFPPLSAAGSLMTTNSSHIGVFSFSFEAPSDNQYLVGQLSGDDRINLLPKNTSGNLSGRINSAASLTGAVSDSFGYTLLNRNSAGTMTIRRGTNPSPALSTLVTASVGVDAVAPADSPITFLRHGSFYAPHMFTAAHGGQLLTNSSMETTVYDIIEEYMWELGSYNMLNSEASSLLAAQEVTPTPKRRVLQDYIIGLLKAANLWDKFYLLYMLSNFSGVPSQLNWIDPGFEFPTDLALGTNAKNYLLRDFDIINRDGPVHLADRGFVGDGVGNYLNSEWQMSPGAGSPADVRNDMALGTWIYTNVAEDKAVVGQVTSSTPRTYLKPRNGSDQAIGRINDDSDFTISGVTDCSGLWVLNRSGASARQVYFRGAEVYADTVASAACRDGPLVWLKSGTFGSAGTHSTQRVSIGFLAQSLNAQEQATLNTIFTLWQRTVGAAA